MLLRIVEKRNGEALVLCSDGKYSKCSSKILKKVFEKIEAAQYIAGEIDGWELKYNQMEDYPGITRAYIDDDFILHIYTPNIFAQLLKSESAAAKPKTAESGKSYLTIAEYAKIVGKSPPRIRVLCSEGRFPGAIRKGRVWLIPEGIPFPEDKRFVENPKRPRKLKKEGSDRTSE